MRRLPNKEMLEYIKSIAKDKTTLEIALLVNQKFNETYTKESMGKYLNRNKIEWKKNISKVRDMGKDYPIGSEYIKDDGMVLVKVSRNKWKYKQRLIYEQYYNVELKEDEYVIFLDDDRTNYDISNLKVVDRKVSSYLGNFNLKGKKKDITLLGCDIASLMIMTKEKGDEYHRIQQEAL